MIHGPGGPFRVHCDEWTRPPVACGKCECCDAADEKRWLDRLSESVIVASWIAGVWGTVLLLVSLVAAC